MTTDRTPAEQLAAELGRHHARLTDPRYFCAVCGQNWPCDQSRASEFLTALSAQLAEQRSINAARESENAAQVEALRHIVGLGSSVPLGMDPESFYHLEMNEAIKTAAWALHPDPSKAATEWRTQVAKEAVSPDRLWKAMRSLAERPEHPIVISWAGNGPEFKRGISEVEMTEALSALLSEDSK